MLPTRLAADAARTAGITEDFAPETAPSLTAAPITDLVPPSTAALPPADAAPRITIGATTRAAAMSAGITIVLLCFFLIYLKHLTR